MIKDETFAIQKISPCSTDLLIMKFTGKYFIIVIALLEHLDENVEISVLIIVSQQAEDGLRAAGE